MSVLTHQEVAELASSSQLISPFSREGLEGASYDMRLGAEYSKGGSIKTLSSTDQSISIEPGEFAMLTTLEMLKLPLHLIGHNGIMSPWAKMGLVSLFSPQIDPGFEGILVVPVYNAGDHSILMRLGQRMFTVEFVRTSTPAGFGWSDKYGVQRNISSHVTTPTASRFPSAETPSLRESTSRLQATSDRLASDINTVKSELLRVEKMIIDRDAKMSETSRSKYSLFASWVAVALSAFAFGWSVYSSRLLDESKPETSPRPATSADKKHPTASTVTSPLSAASTQQ